MRAIDARALYLRRVERLAVVALVVMRRVERLAVVALFTLASVSGCGHDAAGPSGHTTAAGSANAQTAAKARCFQDGVPPPWHWPHDPHELVDGLDSVSRSDAACPVDRPRERAACTLAAEAHCYYVPFATPCDPTDFECKDGAFVAGRIMY